MHHAQHEARHASVPTRLCCSRLTFRSERGRQVRLLSQSCTCRAYTSAAPSSFVDGGEDAPTSPFFPHGLEMASDDKFTVDEENSTNELNEHEIAFACTLCGYFQFGRILARRGLGLWHCVHCGGLAPRMCVARHPRILSAFTLSFRLRHCQTKQNLERERVTEDRRLATRTQPSTRPHSTAQ